MGRVPVLGLALLLLPALAQAALPAAPVPGIEGACAASPPCGRIYPTILIAAGEGTPTLFHPRQGETTSVDAVVTYRFDAANDGYAVVPPTDPIKVSFEYPRKPAWADIKVEPEEFIVPVDEPTHFEPPTDPSQPTMFFSYSQKVVIRFTVTDRAVLRDGYDYAKLLVFAKSTESGLYQAGYGIKELRVAPEGAVHESDVAGTIERFTASPLPALALAPQTATFGGQSVALTPPKDARFWESQVWNVKLQPVPAGRVVLALFDEAGELEAMRGPVDAGTGSLDLNATLARPGLHTFAITLLPAAGGRAPPMTFALDVATDATAQGYEYPKSFVATSAGAVPLPTGNANPPLPGTSNDATIQWERDIPFFSFDSAQSVGAIVTLTTPGAEPLGRGAANLQFSLVDPDGNSLAQASVDPSKPQWALRIGSVPSEGWYTLRLRGAGLPAGSAYDARVEVDYAVAPQAKNRADGVPDITPALSARAGRNLTLPLAGLTVWQPSDVTPKLDKADAPVYQTTVTTNGALEYASGLRPGKATFTPISDGRHRAFVYAEPTLGAPFAPQMRAFTFDVGDGRAVVAQRFAVDDAPYAPTSASETLLAIQAMPIPEAGAKGAGTLTGGRVEVTDAEGKPADVATAGTVYVRALAMNAGAPAAQPLKYALDLPRPLTLQPTPLASGSPPGARLPIPGFAVGLLLGAAGAVAVTVALARRR